MDETAGRAGLASPRANPTLVNKYPDFVHYQVERLTVLCPLMGKRKIAETLARAGLHLGTTTVQRISRAGGHGAAEAAVGVEGEDETEQVAKRTVRASYPDHVWTSRARRVQLRQR
jgi:hypothetical protein